MRIFASHALCLWGQAIIGQISCHLNPALLVTYFTHVIPAYIAPSNVNLSLIINYNWKHLYGCKGVFDI